MKIFFTDEFTNKLNKVSQKQSKLRERFQKQFKLFQQNPTHTGLRLHKLKGKRSEQYAIWILGDLRALVIRDGDSYIFFDLITHDEY